MGNCPSADGKPGAARTSSAVDQEQRDLDRALRVSALESRVDRGKDKRVRRKFERNMEMVHGAGAELGADAQAMKNTQNSAIGAARNIARNVAGTQQRQVEDSAAAAESRNAHLATAAESRLKKSVASDVSKKKRDKNWKIVFGQEDEEEEKATAEMANYSPAEMGSAENEAFEQAICKRICSLRFDFWRSAYLALGLKILENSVFAGRTAAESRGSCKFYAQDAAFHREK